MLEKRGAEGGVEEVKGRKKGDIWNTFNNKDFLKKRRSSSQPNPAQAWKLQESSSAKMRRLSFSNRL